MRTDLEPVSTNCIAPVSASSIGTIPKLGIFSSRISYTRIPVMSCFFDAIFKVCSYSCVMKSEITKTMAFFFCVPDKNFRACARSVLLLLGSNSISSRIIRNTCERPFLGGIYNSMVSENRINPILSLFCVAEKAMVAAISVTMSFLN